MSAAFYNFIILFDCLFVCWMSIKIKGKVSRHKIKLGAIVLKVRRVPFNSTSSGYLFPKAEQGRGNIVLVAAGFFRGKSA